MVRLLTNEKGRAAPHPNILAGRLSLCATPKWRCAKPTKEYWYPGDDYKDWAITFTPESRIINRCRFEPPDKDGL